jgi:ABC-type phosphate/phosphonate transport system substrate-binding protein
MVLLGTPSEHLRQRSTVRFWSLAIFLVISGAAAHGQQAKIDVLCIGTSGTLTSDAPGSKEEGALETLRNFIKEETGLNNEILRQKSWSELLDKMVKGQLHLGVFQGYEFAWAQEKHPDLKPLALAVNVYRYPVAYVVTGRDNKAKTFADLQGQSLALPAISARYLHLFVERQSQANGKELKTFFSKIPSPENVEDALDDVVDGVVQATVVDRAGLEAYKRRKPGRFNRLKEVARSQPFPPTVVVYYGTVLDQATLKRFRDGLLGASRKEKGQTLLTLFRLTGFEAVPRDFDRVVAETRKAYPPPNNTAK